VSGVTKLDAADNVSFDDQRLDFILDQNQPILIPERLLHRMGIEFAIGLRARAANGRPLRPIQHPELNARAIRDPTHESIKRIDLSDKVTFAKTPNRRIARHGANRREFLRDKRGRSAHTSSRRCGLTTGVSTTDHQNVIAHRRPFGSGPFCVSRETLFSDAEAAKN
jgi:hypothetical protein